MLKENASHIRGIKRFTWNLTHLMYNLFKGFWFFLETTFQSNWACFVTIFPVDRLSYLKRHKKRRMMHFPLVLLVCVSYAFKFTCETTDAENSALERVIDLRKVNLLADFQEEENRIFEELPPKCLRAAISNIMQIPRNFINHLPPSQAWAPLCSPPTRWVLLYQ